MCHDRTPAAAPGTSPPDPGRDRPYRRGRLRTARQHRDPLGRLRKPACRCKADPPQLHGPYTSWIRRGDGRPLTRKLTPEQEQRYRPWFDNAKRLRDLLTELENLSVEAFEQAEGHHQQGRS